MARTGVAKKKAPAKKATAKSRLPADLMAPAALTPRQQRFVDEYLVDLNGTQAAKRAGYSPATANEQGARLLANASVRAAVEAGKAERAERVHITQDQVLTHWWAIATADPNELIELRRVCCRYCHGDGHAYQMTAAESERREADWKAAQLRESKRDDAAPDPAPFNPLGGVGFDARKPPHPECPECFGEGVEQPFAKDTRELSALARRLYAGVKVTKDGLEIKMHDQAAALANVAKHLGMFTERHEHTGKDGGPIQTETTTKQEWTVAGRVISWN